MIDWDLWQTLLAVSRTGTFAGAAGSLGIDATTVGRRTKLLERRLGCPLFHRENGRLHPSGRCLALLSRIESAAESLRDAEHESAGTGPGQVWRSARLTAPPFLINHLFAPRIASLPGCHRMRIELVGTAASVSLTRREADLAVRIDDRPSKAEREGGMVEGEVIGELTYAVYCAHRAESDQLPWAGLIERYTRTTGGDLMMKLAGRGGFQFQAYHFGALTEFAAAGIARALLPRFVADADARLRCTTDTLLRQPLWMLYHRQDRAVPHLEAVRSWIREVSAMLR